MAIKNRPTLITQYNNFIDRNPPFDGNPLIQKSEDKSVIQDHLDSQVLKLDESVNVTSADVMELDAAEQDLFIVDVSGHGSSAYTLDIVNLEPGQRIRVELTKKTADVFTVTGTQFWPYSDGAGAIKQAGLTDLSFEAWTVNGVKRASLLASLNTLVVDGGTIFNLKKVDIGDWDMDADGSITVNHGITDGATKILQVFVSIRRDDDSFSQPLNTQLVTGSAGNDGAYTWNDTLVTLSRKASGAFDSADFEDTGFNRGFITIIYDAS